MINIQKVLNFKFASYGRKAINKVVNFTSQKMRVKIISEKELEDNRLLLEYLVNTGFENAFNFNFHSLKKEVINYIENLKIGKETGRYKYSNSTLLPNIYTSLYACMILSLFGELKGLEKKDKDEWINYLNSFQSEKDGLFYDPNLRNSLYDNCDWWGARHLALHAIIAYNNLNSLPKYRFHFLEKYYNKEFLLSFLKSENWDRSFLYSDDIDNKLMNICCLLQYSRDFFNDKKAGESVKIILDFLDNKRNPDTGMWGKYNLNNPGDISRMVQFAYHLFSFFFYDNYQLSYPEKIIDNALKTQNILGGYGVELNSSACEDIDSIDLLIRLSKQTKYKKNEIRKSLLIALPKILSNKNRDGGFVFRRNDPFVYGHHEMSSGKNESSLFATWFRTLSLAYLVRYLDLDNDFYINHCPGLEY